MVPVPPIYAGTRELNLPLVSVELDQTLHGFFGRIVYLTSPNSSWGRTRGTLRLRDVGIRMARWRKENPTTTSPRVETHQTALFELRILSRQMPIAG